MGVMSDQQKINYYGSQFDKESYEMWREWKAAQNSVNKKDSETSESFKECFNKALEKGVK